MYQYTKEIISNPIVGILSSAGISIYTLIEAITPVLQVIGLIIGLGIGVGTLYLNWQKSQKLKRDIQIDDMILKHPEVDEERIKEGSKDGKA